jgi:Asp-tRNA(Asn)/Glu-tRNA(Gln) amidotransferase A subunit family amidase
MEPISTALAAFAAVQKAVQVIKQAQKTVNVGSLAPMLGQYFGAKKDATQALEQAKKEGGSSLAKAVEIEIQLMQQREWEEGLKMIFFQTGRADVWEAIQKRVAEGEQAEREARRRANDAAKKRAKKMAQMVEIGIAIGLLVLLVPPLIWVLIQGLLYAKEQGWFK